MAYDMIIQTRCQKFRFREEGGQLIEHLYGKMYQGVVCLKIYDNDSFRITLGDLWNCAKALAKDVSAASSGKWFKTFKRYMADDLCHFDWSKAELDCGVKEVRVKASYVNDTMLFMLGGYDFQTMEGRAYFFRDYDEIKRWASAIGIEEYEIFDAETGSVYDIECF